MKNFKKFSLYDEETQTITSDHTIITNPMNTEQREMTEQDTGWKLSNEKTPRMNSHIEYSEDGVTAEGTLNYIERRTCIMAGIAGGYGYFGEGFATDGENGVDAGLICDAPKYWRYIVE